LKQLLGEKNMKPYERFREYANVHNYEEALSVLDSFTNQEKEEFVAHIKATKREKKFDEFIERAVKVKMDMGRGGKQARNIMMQAIAKGVDNW